MFAKYFADIYTPQSNDRYDDENFQTISSEYVNMKFLNECDERLEYEIAESEVNKGIVSLKLRKAPGVDNVHAEHLKYGGKKVALYLSRLF